MLNTASCQEIFLHIATFNESCLKIYHEYDFVYEYKVLKIVPSFH